MDIKAFGLTVDNTGAVRAIKEVGDKGAQLARDGAKAAQEYAEAFRDRLGEIARRYIPDTMRAIDALRDKQRQLVVSSPGAVGGLFNQSEMTRVAKAFDALKNGMAGVSASAGPAIRSTVQLQQSLMGIMTPVAAATTGLSQYVLGLGAMALTSAITAGAIAGAAMLTKAWENIGREAREAAKAQDDAIKKFEEMQRKRGQGAGGETVDLVAKMRERMESDRATIASLQATPVDAYARGKGITDPGAAASIAARAAEIAKLQKNIADGEAFIAEQVAKAGATMVERQVSDLANLIAAHKATAGEIQNAKALVQGLTASLNALSGDGSKNAERSALIAQIRELNDALYPKKESRDAARDAAREAKEAQDIADRQANERNKLVIAGIKQRAAERIAAEKAAAKDVKETVEREARAIGDAVVEGLRRQQAQEEYVEDMKRIWRRGLDSIVTYGLSSFRAFFDSVLGLFNGLMSKMEQAGKNSGGLYKALGIGAAGIGGAFAGLAIGGLTTNRGLGGLGGAAAGALTGSAYGPWGAAAGALTGFIGGIVGAGNAAREAARQMDALQSSLRLSIEAFAASGRGDTLSATIAGIKAQAEAMRQALETLFPESLRNTQIQVYADAAAAARAEYDRQLKQINDAEAANIARLKDEAKAIRETTSAGLNLVQGYKLQRAVFTAMAGQSGPTPRGGTLSPPGSRTDSVSDSTPIVLNIDGSVVLKATVKQLRTLAARKGISSGELYKALA